MKRFTVSVAATVLSAIAGAALAQTPPPAGAPATVQAAPAAPAPAAAADGGGGKIAWYGRKFAGRKTASGERFNPGALTMAHKTMPFGTRVKVTNTKNDRSVVVRVNDRGPTRADLVGDVSLAAAQKLRMVRSGVVEARFEVVGEAPKKAARP